MGGRTDRQLVYLISILILDFSLRFPEVGAAGNCVRKQGGMLNLSKMSFCFWLKATRNHMTVFSYLSTRGIKELMFHIVDTNYLKLTVGGEST